MCFKKFNSGVNKNIFPELRLSFFDKRFIFFDTPRIYGKMTGLSGGLKKQRGLFHKRPPYRFSIGIILRQKDCLGYLSTKMQLLFLSCK